MAADSRNFAWYRYTDNELRNWGLRADKEYGDQAPFGLAPFNAADPPFGPQSRRHRPRALQYKDPVTFRTRVIIVGTSAALATAPATIAVVVPGVAAPVTYTKAATINEKLQIPGTSQHLAEHP